MGLLHAKRKQIKAPKEIMLKSISSAALSLATILELGEIVQFLGRCLVGAQEIYCRV